VSTTKDVAQRAKFPLRPTHFPQSGPYAAYGAQRSKIQLATGGNRWNYKYVVGKMCW
jgi:hypothetical protein